MGNHEHESHRSYNRLALLQSAREQGLLSGLSDRQRFILEQRYGADIPRTHEELGVSLGITRGGSWLIEKKAFEILRQLQEGNQITKKQRRLLNSTRIRNLLREHAREGESLQDFIQRANQEYGSGRKAASHHKVTPEIWYKWMKLAGVESTVAQETKRKWEARKEEIYNFYYRERYTLGNLARRYQVSEGAIRVWMNKWGYVRRKR